MCSWTSGFRMKSRHHKYNFCFIVVVLMKLNVFSFFACWIVYLCSFSIACLPVVWQEFHRELVKQQEARGSWGNGHKPVLLTTAMFFFLFVCVHVCVTYGPSFSPWAPGGICLWVDFNFQVPVLSWAMSLHFVYLFIFSFLMSLHKCSSEGEVRWHSRKAHTKAKNIFLVWLKLAVFLSRWWKHCLLFQ